MNPAVKVINQAVALTVVTEGETCSRCRREAVLVQRYSGRALCREHLIRDIESRANRAVRRQGGLRPNDRVAVSAGAGPARTALLSFLERRRGGERMHVRVLSEDGAEDPLAAAAGLGCTVLVEDAVLDDVASRVLRSVLAGRQVELLSPPEEGAVRRIRPFCDVPGAEVRLYASFISGIPDATLPVPADLAGAELARHAADHPSAPFALARLADALAAIGTEGRDEC